MYQLYVFVICMHPLYVRINCFYVSILGICIYMQPYIYIYYIYILYIYICMFIDMRKHLSEGSRFFQFPSLVDSFRWAFFSQHCGDDSFHFEFDCEAPRLGLGDSFR